MTDLTAYPLAWPAAWSRNPRPQRSRFDTTMAQARDGLIHELRLLGATQIVLSSNVKLRHDGLPYAVQREPDDPGVAAWFLLDGEQRCIAVDAWDRVGDNLQAIRLTVAALRGISRWGSTGLVTAAFAGFAALPAGSTAGEAWWEVLSASPDADLETIEACYRLRARETHPDMGGNSEAFHRLTEAYRVAKEQRG